MSRKRTPKEPTADTNTAVAEPPAAELPVAELAPVEAPAAEPKADGQTFAERVGQKKWTPAPDPFGIAKDNAAGVRLFESRQDRQMAIKFGDGGPDHKPSQAVIDRMKEAGYRWNPSDRVWTHPVGGDNAMSTRIEAEQLYQEVRQMIRQEKGIEASQDVPFQQVASMIGAFYNISRCSRQGADTAGHAKLCNPFLPECNRERRGDCADDREFRVPKGS